MSEPTEISFQLDQDTDGIYISEDMKILYVLSGRTAVFSQNRNFLLHTADFVVFNPFEAHEVFVESGGHILSCLVDANILNHYRLGEVECCSVLAGERGIYLDQIRRHLSVMFKALYSKTQDLYLYCMGELFGLLSILREHFGKTDGKRSAGSGGDWEEIRGVLDYLEENYGQSDISLQGIADVFHLSPSTLSRKFEKIIGMAFSDCLRMIRLKEAAYRLRSGSDSVTTISEECGFSSVNTMIRTFRNRYGATPLQYRKNLGSLPDVRDPNADVQTQMALLSFLRYAMEQEAARPLAKPQASSEKVVIDREHGCKRRGRGVSKIYLCGLISDLLSEESWQVLDKSLSEISFSWIHVVGVFDDALGVYRRSVKKEENYNFKVLDSILGRLSKKGRLWIELSRIPRAMLGHPGKFYQGEYVDFPDNLDEWSELVRRFLLHLCECYGREMAQGRRYSVMSPTITLFEREPFTRYLLFYKATVVAVQDILPGAQISSGAFDLNLLSADGPAALEEFLSFAAKEECLPDILCMQEFQRDYRIKPLFETKELLLKDGTGEHMDEPAPPAKDGRVILQDVEGVREILRSKGLQNMPIALIFWNVTNWAYDLSCDTCYAAAFYAKHLAENENHLESASFRVWDVEDEENEFHGGNGIMSHRRIPKASWNVLQLYDRLETEVLSQGDGYIATCDASKTRISILLYNYCHYNLHLHLREVLTTSEQQSVDRYSAFEGEGTKAFLLSFEDWNAPAVTIETYAINREYGSSYDIWKKMGAPQKLTREQEAYLCRLSEPEYHIDKISDLRHEMLNLPIAVDEHEVKLLIIHPIR